MSVPRNTRQIGDPDERQPDIDIPLGLGIFAGLGDAEQIARGGEDDEELVAPEHEPGEIAESEPRPAGALDDIEAGGDQSVAAKSKDDRRGMQRPQTAEIGPWQVEIEHRKGELQGDDHAHEKPGQPQNTVAMTPALMTSRNRCFPLRELAQREQRRSSANSRR